MMTTKKLRRCCDTPCDVRHATHTAEDDLFIVSFVVAPTNCSDDHSLGITTHWQMPCQSASARSAAWRPPTHQRLAPLPLRPRPSQSAPHSRLHSEVPIPHLFGIAPPPSSHVLTPSHLSHSPRTRHRRRGTMTRCGTRSDGTSARQRTPACS